jgi:hypothetical protein
LSQHGNALQPNLDGNFILTDRYSMRRAQRVQRDRRHQIRMAIWYSLLWIELLIILTVVFPTGAR